MKAWYYLGLALIAVLTSSAQADEPLRSISPPPPAGSVSSPWAAPALGFVLNDPFSANGSEASDIRDAAKFRPAHIRDNAFLVEEAFNQETGVVQHIFNWVHAWDRTTLSRTRDFAFAYTMEVPLGSQDHQFSFTTQFLSGFEKARGDPGANQGGVGDTFLNYRYQLLADDDFLWCAPRASLIVPTGDERFDLGTGRLGYQFNLPISRYGDQFDFHFNAGFTYVPNVSVPLNGAKSMPQDLRGYNLGGSVFWKPETNLHFFVEVLGLHNEAIDELGVRAPTTQIFLNPGVRYAICQFEDVEWVVGVSVPIGLTRDTPDIGVFAYMSIEHAMRKASSIAH